MFRKSTFVLIVFVLLSNGSANEKPQNVSSNLAPDPGLSDKAPQPMRQTFNINNWGFGKADRKLLTEMKYKIDSLYEKSCQKSTKVCPEDGWVRYGNYLFLIINIPTLKWSDARRTCQMLGADLAIIRSAAENTFIFDLVKKQKTVTAWGAWLGFVRKADTKFYWLDGTPLTRGYATWGSTEPNNARGKENCSNMYGTGAHGGKWNDLQCDSFGQLKNAPVILCKKKAN